MISNSFRNTLLLILVMLTLSSGVALTALTEYEVRDRVNHLKQWLRLSPDISMFPDAQISAADLDKRKQEIKSEINALLAASRQEYSTRDVTFLGYLSEKGALSLDVNPLKLHMFIRMSKPDADIVTRNPSAFYLTAVRELNFDLEWVYYNWTLKGKSEVYHQQPEPVYDIPTVPEIEINPEAVVDISQVIKYWDASAKTALSHYEAGDYESALEGFASSEATSNDRFPAYYYWLAKSQLELGEVDEARYWLDRYLLSGDEYYLKEARSLYELINRQQTIFSRVSRREVPAYLRSREGDAYFTYNPAEASLYFSSNRPSSFNGMNIWKADKLNDSWTNPKLVSELSSNTDEAVCSFSTDGKTAYLMGKWSSVLRSFDIHQSSKKDGIWQAPQPISQLNTPSDDMEPYVYNDEYMFFSSNRPGGLGGYDLYFSRYVEGQWSAPINLGEGINTAGDETGPFLDWDGKTLYFCSTGYSGFGDADVYKVVRVGDTGYSWSLPENLGSIINTRGRERRFYHIRNSNQAIVTREGVKGTHWDYLNLEYAPRSYWELIGGKAVWTMDADPVSPISGLREGDTAIDDWFVLHGQVRDEASKALNASVVVHYVQQGSRYSETLITDKGSYRGVFPRSDGYRVECSMDGYSLFTAEVLPKPKESERKLDIVMQKLVLNKEFVFSNIQFEYNSAELTKASEPILNDVARTLLNNPELRMEIGGHTCNTGGEQYNLELSRNRAASVVQYLVSKGIPASRLVSKGYGLAQPIADNSTPEGRERNRRVVVKVIK